MSLSENTRSKIENLVRSDPVVLFMKGQRTMPQCGFSAKTVSTLDKLIPNYVTIDVLEDSEVREGIKAYANWPTIPQLYVNGEFVGGCDIIQEAFNSGELFDTLGVDQPEKVIPKITISDSAVKFMKSGLGSNPDMSVHLDIDNHWQHQLTLGPATGQEVVAEDKGIQILMDPITAQRAQDISIEVKDSLEGTGLDIKNPNAPE